MKTISILLILSLASLLAACGSDKQEAADATAEADSLNSVLSADEVLYLDASEKLVGTFTRELKSELLAAINKSGPAGAISVCKVKAPEISMDNSAGGWTIKRVTDRFRNPDNRADSAEMSMLANFADTSGTAPEYLFDWLETDSSKTFRFYKPIYVKPLCLKCHGGLQTLGTGVYETLKKKYPLDRAIEYKTGELRGMFVVEARWPEGKEQAALLVNDMVRDEPSDSIEPVSQ